VEKRLVEDIKRLFAELTTAREELEAEHKSHVDSESALRTHVAEVEALKETTMQSLRDSTFARAILKKELDGDCGFLFALFLYMPCFFSNLSFLIW
jgi:hypothetical protein